MRNSPFPLIIFFCCLIRLPGISDANQAEQLRTLIRSANLSSSSHDDSWMDSSSSRYSSPVHVSPQDGMKEADRVTALPGQPGAVGFAQYAGYVNVDEKTGRALFYYFVESAPNPSVKPLLLWLNGGPGCSSFIGAMSEIGPFRVNSDRKTLSLNNFAWNNVANVLFLESPAGVGFSYSNTTSDYDKSGDKRTSDDSYIFLVNWLERFPQYKIRPFYIAGESYAGHYIPELATAILQRNKLENRSIINLQGIAIGNAYVDAVTNNIGTIDFFWSHALISDETYAMIKEQCNFSGNISWVKCNTAQDNAYKEVGNIDTYNIYAPVCHDSTTSTRNGHVTGEFDPCTLDYVNSYLNNPEVRKSLHADARGSPKSWNMCSRLPWNDAPLSMEPIIKWLISSNINIWLYSGDTDAAVPITATRYFIKKLGLTVRTSWRPWAVNNEVGGYVEEYNGLTLATVRGAGHLVPSDQPERALQMIAAFLQGQLPS